ASLKNSTMRPQDGPNQQRSRRDGDGGVGLSIPPWFWAVLCVFGAWGAISPNPALTLFSLLLLPLLWALLWRGAEPPVLLFACGMQWLQAAVLIFHNNYHGTALGGGTIESRLPQASWLSLSGVFVVALGMRLALIRSQPISAQNLKDEALRLVPPRLFSAYIGCLLAASVLERFVFARPGLSQLIFGLLNLKWLPAFLLAYAVLTQRKHYGLLGVVFAIEFSTGVLGFFSGFKSVFFILLVVGLGVQRLRQRTNWGAILALIGVLFVTALVWTAVKGEYRTFLNQGTGQQQVLVSVPQRVEVLAGLVRHLTPGDFNDAFDGTLMRIAYVELFGDCIENVPSTLPYENGALWLGAVQRIFMPRIFFPNKAIVDDSERARKYTGREFAGREEGTSIGIGYMAESYVDFGPWLMFVPVLLLGVFYGLIYRLFSNRGPSRLLGLANACAILAFGAYTIETSNIKLIGMNTSSFLVLGFIYWRFGRSFMQWVTRPQPGMKGRRTSRRGGAALPSSKPDADIPEAVSGMTSPAGLLQGPSAGA
ncbi:MAG: hypothetical protein WCL11_27950, partial [Verrucomicrobiota bacterium]